MKTWSQQDSEAIGNDIFKRILHYNYVDWHVYRNEIELVHQLPIKEHIYESTDEVITKEEPEVPPTLESEDLTDKETAQANVNTQNDEKTA